MTTGSELNALKLAKGLIEKDEFGEIQLYKQIYDDCGGHSENGFETIEKAVIYGNETFLEWYPI